MMRESLQHATHRDQLDIPYANRHFFSLPKHLPGRTMADDFVFFTIPENVDPTSYSVIVESLDTAGPTFRSIGPLNKAVELPLVHFDWEAKIGVVPNTDENKPSFWAKLNRGSTYIIPRVRGNGRYQMDRHGVSRP